MDDIKYSMPQGKVVHLPGYDRAQAEVMPDQARPAAKPGNVLAAMLLRARAEFREVAVLVLRIREFRELAESFGDSCGQHLAQEIRRRLDDCLRDSDQVVPMGAGEFVIVVPQPEDLHNIDMICERLVQACSGHYQLEDVTPVVNAAIGIALYPADSGEVDDVIRFARIALRRAEADSSKDFDYFSMEMLKRQRYKIWMEGELDSALAERRFTLHYQPQYTLQSNEISGMEALVRLVTREGDIIPPDDFIGIAEETGFIVQLGHWVVREACRQLAHWRRDGYGPAQIAVNVSPRQLLDAQLLDVVDESISEYGLEHSDLVLEVTESCMLDYLPVAGDILHRLHDSGVQIAVDDFGAGYSSFATLAQLPLDIFKMDRSFMARVSDEPRARHVVTALIAMARELGYQVVAEGVETAQQHRFLQDSGCDHGQGFGLARPQDAQAIGILLQSNGAGAVVTRRA